MVAKQGWNFFNKPDVLLSKLLVLCNFQIAISLKLVLKTILIMLGKIFKHRDLLLFKGVDIPLGMELVEESCMICG